MERYGLIYTGALKQDQTIEPGRAIRIRISYCLCECPC